MAKIIAERMCAQVEGDFVVFLIGARINHLWKFWKWWPVATAMPRMLAELSCNPDMGLMNYYICLGPHGPVLVQYWRSFDALEAYAKARESEHLPAWAAFNRSVGSNGDVGIWHETYRIQAGAYESVYNNMPAFGLGQAGKLVEARGARQSARQRLSAGG